LLPRLHRGDELLLLLLRLPMLLGRLRSNLLLHRADGLLLLLLQELWLPTLLGKLRSNLLLRLPDGLLLLLLRGQRLPMLLVRINLLLQLHRADGSLLLLLQELRSNGLLVLLLRLHGLLLLLLQGLRLQGNWILRILMLLRLLRHKLRYNLRLILGLGRRPHRQGSGTDSSWLRHAVCCFCNGCPEACWSRLWDVNCRPEATCKDFTDLPTDCLPVVPVPCDLRATGPIEDNAKDRNDNVNSDSLARRRQFEQ
jgi:hypothetical protein